MSLLSRVRPRSRANTEPVVKTKTIPAPIRGLNFQNSLAAMKPGDALRLDDMICRPGYVEVRKGWQPTATGFASNVESLFPYTSVAGANKLFAAAGTAFYDATTSGAIGAAVVSGLTNAYWFSTQVSNVAGNYMICCNGVDNAKIYDGAVWANLAVTVLAITSITHVAVWKHRLWFVEKNSTNAWYLAADAIAGAAVQFPLGGTFKRGGRLQAIVNWTIDGGSGSDDYLLFVSSMGEVAVYKGTDPAAASTFALVGTYYVGKPTGERFYAQYGGDVLMLTSDGLVPFSRYLQSATVDKSTFLTNRIQQLISDEESAYGSVQGWEVHVFLGDNFILIQVPSGSVGSRYQYVMSTLTGGWSRFRVSPAICWMVQGDTLYHGQATRVANAWTGGLDNTAGINFVVIPAFSDFGLPTIQKHFTLGRLTIQSDQQPNYVSSFLKDFDQNYSTPSLPIVTPSGSLWDVGLWDAAVWGGQSALYRSWYSLNGLGYVGSQVITGISTGSIFRIIAEDYVYQPGGLL